MGPAAWAAVCGIAGAISVVSVAFFFWWFPGTIKRGFKADNERLEALDDGDREARRQRNRETIRRFKRARAMERERVVELDERLAEAQEIPPPAYLAPPEYSQQLAPAEGFDRHNGPTTGSTSNVHPNVTSHPV